MAKPRFGKQEVAQRLREKLGTKKGPKTICLTMIVKNESKNMVRLLDSAKSIIDMISIVDTGSTDDTKEIIAKWGKTNNIPTTIHQEPFKNFSYNRTHSVRSAKKAYPNADFFLLSDADFIWEINTNGKFDKALLVDQKYLIEQFNGILKYWNIRLLSAKVDWECVGVTHEYWNECKEQSSYIGPIRAAKITTLSVDDKEDGGCKTNKFLRDEQLLREGLEDPDTTDDLKSRYKFYLAQTLKDTGRYEESIIWYKKRIEHGGWAEEVYYSKFQLGVNNEQLAAKKQEAAKILKEGLSDEKSLDFLEKWNPDSLSPEGLMNETARYFSQAEEAYLNAYKYRKTRAEALYRLVRILRIQGKNYEALNYAIEGNKIKYPNDDTLFIEAACYDYLFDFEVGITAYYVNGKKDLGRETISRLIERTDIPQQYIESVANMSRFYI
jgi:glycosyltransferase involved in cell wall biosynthesis